jgi:membrane-associated phospholipid phosphatase
VTADRAFAAASALAVALSTAAPLPAAAADEGPHPIRWNLRQDLLVTGIGGALWIGSGLAKGRLAPDVCRFCGTNSLDARAREVLLWSDLRAARRSSDVLAYAVLPTAIAAHQILAARGAGSTSDDGLVDLLVVAEAAVLAADLNHIVKFAVGRQRPYARYGNRTDPDRALGPDDNLSFYSGHASLAFSLAAAAGTVSSLRGYESTPWVWAGGLTIATGIAYLRVAGDKHYLTDVLSGAAIGTAFGIAIPRLLHGREEKQGQPTARVSVVPYPLGVFLVW